MHRNRIARAALLPSLALACTSLAGCALWPWGGGAQPAPEPVHELVVTVPADLAMPVVLQFQERNTLVVDLQDVATAGQLRLSRHDGRDWPARIALRMSSTRFQQLEVRGDQRIVLTVAGADGSPVTAELPPGIYGPGTPVLVVSWGASGAF